MVDIDRIREGLMSILAIIDAADKPPDSDEIRILKWMERKKIRRVGCRELYKNGVIRNGQRVRLAIDNLVKWGRCHIVYVGRAKVLEISEFRGEAGEWLDCAQERQEGV
jgi:hypothetical protein